MSSRCSQPRDVVYHDDVGDYSTNEPTMDGTADAILVMALWSRKELADRFTVRGLDPNFEVVQGGVIRGDIRSKKMALVFTGDEFAEGGNR